MQSLGVELMHTGNHVVGIAIYHLLRQVEGTETMPMWVHKKIQTSSSMLVLLVPKRLPALVVFPSLVVSSKLYCL
jgi:hypothetical protein